jgi:hypothetical protein
VQISEGIAAAVRILGNDGSDRSTVRIALTTEAAVSSIRIDALALTSLPRNSAHQFSVIVNGGEPADGSEWGIVWAVADTSYATVDQRGNVTTKNKIGTVILVVTDPASGLHDTIVLRIT